MPFVQIDVLLAKERIDPLGEILIVSVTRVMGHKNRCDRTQKTMKYVLYVSVEQLFHRLRFSNEFFIQFMLAVVSLQFMQKEMHVKLVVGGHPESE